MNLLVIKMLLRAVAISAAKQLGAKHEVDRSTTGSTATAGAYLLVRKCPSSMQSARRPTTNAWLSSPDPGFPSCRRRSCRLGQLQQGSARRGQDSGGRGAADDPDARAALDSVTLDRIPVEAFSDQIVDGFSGADYFSVLDVLDGVATNANHRALAELAARGALRAIVTTNFDTLIERAFRERGVALQVFAQPQDFERPPAFDNCVLYKIHGTVGADTTFVDTVSQKMRGLGPAKRTHLHARLRRVPHSRRRVFGRRSRVRPGLSRFRRAPEDAPQPERR